MTVFSHLLRTCPSTNFLSIADIPTPHRERRKPLTNQKTAFVSISCRFVFDAQKRCNKMNKFQILKNADVSYDINKKGNKCRKDDDVTLFV
jgi:hypothetical protein